MKKLLALTVLLFSLPAFCGEPLMLINPSRETFINFPSAVLGNDKTVTVFLPEPAVPLRGKYPVVYLLGAGPKDAAAAQARLEASARKAILVGVNFDEKDLADTAKITAFFSRELVPYIDTNYPTVDDPSSRAVSSRGAAGAKALAALLARKNLFARAVIVDGGETPVSLAGSDRALRVLVAGKRSQAVVWQKTLEDMGLSYGPGFVTALGGDENLFSSLNLDYLFAPAQELAVKKLKGTVSPSVLYLEGEDKAKLSVSAQLANAMTFDYVPLSVRLSPPYLDWNAAAGELAPIPGAAAGKVKIGVFVDKKAFNGKIRLKK